MTYFFYSTHTGLFHAQGYDGPADHLGQNTPAEHAAIQGEFDRFSQRVDLQTGKVVDYRPPAPPDESGRTWVWDTPTKRWTPVPTLAALKALRIAEIQTAIEAQEKAQDRPQRELMTAFRLSLPAPAVALNRMTAIDSEIARLRALRTACATASTKAQLDAVQRP